MSLQQPLSSDSRITLQLPPTRYTLSSHSSSSGFRGVETSSEDRRGEERRGEVPFDLSQPGQRPLLAVVNSSICFNEFFLFIFLKKGHQIYVGC